jgi:hypothetical protein
VVVTDSTGGAGPGSGDAAAGPSAGFGGSPAAKARPDHSATAAKDSGSGATAVGTVSASNWFDASALGGLLGVGPDPTSATTSAGPAATGAPPAAVELALAGQDHRSSPSSVVLLGASLLILLALAGGVAVRWWVGRSNRYWPA